MVCLLGLFAGISSPSKYDEMVKAAVALNDGTATAEAILIKAIQLLQCGASDLQGSCRGWQGREDIFLCDYLSARETQKLNTR